MQDRKALQAGTSHFLGQNFAKASGIKFQTAEEKEEFAWTTSWGTSTRLIGGVIMTHGDDDGVIMPPRVSPAHLVLLPIFRNDDERTKVMEYTASLAAELREIYYHHARIRVEIDDRNIGGARGWEWIKKGIPLRVEIGPRDISENAVFVGRRDMDHRQKKSLKREVFMGTLCDLLDEIQGNLFDRARAFTDDHTRTIDAPEDFYRLLHPRKHREARDSRRLRHEPLVRRRGMRGQDQGGSHGHHPLHAPRQGPGKRPLHLLREAFGRARGLRKSLLNRIRGNPASWFVSATSLIK